MKEMCLYNGDVYYGRFKNKGNWWFDDDFEHSFEIFNLDSLYSGQYFKQNYMTDNVSESLVQFMCHIYSRITGRPLASLFEAGCAGGWFTEALCKRGVDVVAVEGSKTGVELARHRTKLSSKEIIHHDLRRRIDLGRTFDMAFCVEVAEHIEPPFSSVLIETLVQHADLIWFSSTGPQAEGDLNHSNEQPVKFWVNLFDFFGFDHYRMPDVYSTVFRNRGQFIFYRKNKFPSVKWNEVFNAQLSFNFPVSGGI